MNDMIKKCTECGEDFKTASTLRKMCNDVCVSKRIKRNIKEKRKGVMMGEFGVRLVSRPNDTPSLCCAHCLDTFYEPGMATKISKEIYEATPESARKLFCNDRCEQRARHQMILELRQKSKSKFKGDHYSKTPYMTLRSKWRYVKWKSFRDEVEKELNLNS